MGLRLVTLSVVIFSSLTNIHAREIYQQVRVYYTDDAELEELQKAGIPLDHVRIKKGVFVDVVATREQVARLRELGIRFDILQEDLTRFYRRRFQPARKFDKGFELGSMGGNYTYDEMAAELDSLHALYPSLVSEKMSIGLSLEGRDIWAVRVSDENVDGDSEPRVLYTGLTHAREPVGMMNLIYFMYYLCENYGTDDEATDVVDNRELWFVPIANPDGYVYNERIAPDGGGMHRKNRRDTGCGEGSGRGVDLNRNYGYNWGLNDYGSSPDSCSQVFRGVSSFSEHETSVLRDFMLSMNFTNILHYHTFSNILIHSFGTGEYPPEPDLGMLRAYADEMTEINHYRVGTGPETMGYPVNGDAVDYSYGTLGLIAYTPEVGTYDDFFWPPTDRIVPLCEENVWSNLYFAKIAGTLLEIGDVQMTPASVEPGDSVSFSLTLQNMGLRASLGSVRATLSPLNSLMDFEPVSLDVGSLERWQSVDFPVGIITIVDSSARPGCPAGIGIQMDDRGDEAYGDTVSFLIGTSSVLFMDDAESGMDSWVGTGWSFSLESYEGDHSIGSGYGPDFYPELVLKEPIDLSDASHATLEFWARWDIEPVWDFVQVQASTDGHDWSSLWGIHTKGGTGNGVQPSGEPGYDGSQAEWVRERVDLSAFDGEMEVYIRFLLMSDGGVEGEGFYIDNIEVVAYPALEIALGDVTRDCVIDVGDVLAVIDIILDRSFSTTLEQRLADMNGDETVNVFDIVLLVDAILGT